MKKPRVLHVTPALFGRRGVYGGAERYAFELARHMATVVPTTLVSFAEKPDRFMTKEGLRVQVLGPAWSIRGQPLNPLHLGLIREVAQADIVHCHQRYVLASEVCALLGRIGNRRVYASDLGGGGWNLSGRLNTTNWFRGHLHISEYSRAISSQANSRNAQVIYGGVDTEFFSPGPTRVREPLALFVGRQMPHKGVDDLIQALPGGMTLELIGRPYHKEYAAKLRKLAVGKQIIFRDTCDDKGIVEAYRRASCVVLPSVYIDCYGNESLVPELLGQAPLEGMACGTPAIVTSVASLPEIVENGVNGYVIPPNNPAALRDKLQYVLDNPVQASTMGSAGRTWVLERFTWRKVVERCLSAYSESI